MIQHKIIKMSGSCWQLPFLLAIFGKSSSQGLCLVAGLSRNTETISSLCGAVVGILLLHKSRRYKYARQNPTSEPIGMGWILNGYHISAATANNKIKMGKWGNDVGNEYIKIRSIRLVIQFIISAFDFIDSHQNANIASFQDNQKQIRP